MDDVQIGRNMFEIYQNISKKSIEQFQSSSSGGLCQTEESRKPVPKYVMK